MSFSNDISMSPQERESMLKSLTETHSLTDRALNLPPEKMKWWQDAKFGMFIHWGLYSILGRGEWAMFNEKIPKDEYAKLADSFDPMGFDADAWMSLAEKAGCKYAVMVTRHHDGFALWDSDGSYGGYTSAKHAAGRDFVSEYTKACRDHGLAVGLYYSPMDWRFPGYFDPHGKRESAEDMKKQCYCQVEELVRDFGKIDILWYDGGWLNHTGSDADAAWLWEPVKLNAMVRGYQPDVVINPRSGYDGDFVTDEGGHPSTGEIRPYPWEKCLTAVNGAWGYIPTAKVRPSEALIRLMVDTFVRGGNVLLNVGPDADGVIPEDQARVFTEIGQWMSRYGESVYGTRGGPVQPVDGVYGVTSRDKTLYLHVTDTKLIENEIIPIDFDMIESATLLTDGDLTVSVADGGVKFSFSNADSVDTIVKIEMK